MKFNSDSIAALVCTPGKREMLVFDDIQPGFGVRVTAAGAKIFIFQYKRGAAARRMTIGHVEVEPGVGFTLVAARKLAQVWRGQVAAGLDPWAMKVATRAEEARASAAKKEAAKADAFTLESLVAAWEETGLRTASAAHRRDAPASIRRTFARHLGAPAASLKLAAIKDALNIVAKKHPIAALRARDYANAAANWAVSRQLLDSNPFAAVQVDAKEVSRERALTDDELGAVWRAVDTLGYPFGPLLKLLLSSR